MTATAVPAQPAPTPFPTPRPAAREQEIHAMQRTLNPTSSRQHQDEIQFRIILGVTYPFFLIASHYHYACGMKDELARTPLI